MGKRRNGRLARGVPCQPAVSRSFHIFCHFIKWRGLETGTSARGAPGRRTSGHRMTARGRAWEGNASGGIDARPRGGAGATYGRGRGTPTGGHRRRGVGEGGAGAAREKSAQRALARLTSARGQTREGDAGGGTSARGMPRRRGRRPRGAIGRRPHRGPYARERTDAGGGRRRKDARAGVVLVVQVHAGMEAGLGGADQGEFAQGTPVRGAGPKLP